MKVVNNNDYSGIRLSVEDGDIIEIEPVEGELMAYIKIVFINEKTNDMPHGAMDLVVMPMHMDGSLSTDVTVRIKG